MTTTLVSARILHIAVGEALEALRNRSNEGSDLLNVPWSCFG